MIRYLLSERITAQHQLEQAVAADFAAESLERQLKARQERELAEKELEEAEKEQRKYEAQGESFHPVDPLHTSASTDDVGAVAGHDFFEHNASDFEPVLEHQRRSSGLNNRPGSAFSVTSSYGLEDLDSLFPTRPGSGMSVATSVMTADTRRTQHDRSLLPPRPASSMAGTGSNRLVPLPQRPTTALAIGNTNPATNVLNTTGGGKGRVSSSAGQVRRPVSVGDIMEQKNTKWSSTYQDLVELQEVEIWGKVKKKPVDIYAPYRPWKEGSKEDFENRMIAATVNPEKYRLELRRMELQDELQATLLEAKQLEEENHGRLSKSECADLRERQRTREIEDLKRVESEAAADVAACESFFQPKTTGTMVRRGGARNTSPQKQRRSIRACSPYSAELDEFGNQLQSKEDREREIQLRATNLDLDAHTLGKSCWLKQNSLKEERKVWTPGTTKIQSAVSEWQVPEEHKPWVSSHPCVIRRDDGLVDHIAPSRTVVGAICDSAARLERQHLQTMEEVKAMRQKVVEDCDFIDEPKARRKILDAEHNEFHFTIIQRCSVVVMPCLHGLEFGLKRQERAEWNILFSMFETRKLVIEAKQLQTPYIMEHRPLTRRNKNHQDDQENAVVTREQGGECSRDYAQLMERNRQEVVTAEEASKLLRAVSDKHQDFLREKTRKEWRQTAAWREELVKTQQEKLRWKEQRRAKRTELKEVGRRLQEQQEAGVGGGSLNPTVTPAKGSDPFASSVSKTSSSRCSSASGFHSPNSKLRLNELRSTPQKQKLPAGSRPGTAASAVSSFLDDHYDSALDMDDCTSSSVGVGGDDVNSTSATSNTIYSYSKKHLGTHCTPPPTQQQQRRTSLTDDESMATTLKQRLEYLEWSIANCEQREADLKKKLGLV